MTTQTATLTPLTSPPDMRIAGTKTVKDWDDLRVKLVPGGDPLLWDQAFTEFFIGRIESRYLKPIDVLEDALRAAQKKNLNEKTQYLGEGFSIVAILCTLVEFLQTTIEGTSFKLKGAVGKNFEYGLGESAKIFVRFLTTATPFKDSFDDALAGSFYADVRCGLLHEARIKGGWRINVDSKSRVIAEVASDKSSKTLYRNNMRAAFATFNAWYAAELRKELPRQEAFLRKFNSLCCE